MKVINLHQEESDLIRLAVGNNRQAQQIIYSRYSARMLSVCRQYIKDLQHAEDLMLTAFMKVFTNLKTFEHEGNFEGWIRRIMVNECISFIRAKKETTFLDEINHKETGSDNDHCDYDVNEIQQLIDNLPDGYRMVFNLYVVEGYKHQEIADMLGISEGTSKSQLSHARKTLQEQILKLNSYNYGTE